MAVGDGGGSSICLTAGRGVVKYFNTRWHRCLPLSQASSQGHLPTLHPNCLSVMLLSFVQHWMSFHQQCHTGECAPVTPHPFPLCQLRCKLVVQPWSPCGAPSPRASV